MPRFDQKIELLLEAKEAAFSRMPLRMELRKIVVESLDQGPLAAQVLAAAIAYIVDDLMLREKAFAHLIALAEGIGTEDALSQRFLAEVLLFLSVDTRPEMFNRAFLSFLLRAVKFGDSFTRPNAVCVLGRYAQRNDPAAAQALTEALSDPDVNVRKNAEIMLRKSNDTTNQ